jgi:hypothetical protein
MLAPGPAKAKPPPEKEKYDSVPQGQADVKALQKLHR